MLNPFKYYGSYIVFSPIIMLIINQVGHIGSLDYI